MSMLCFYQKSLVDCYIADTPNAVVCNNLTTSKLTSKLPAIFDVQVDKTIQLNMLFRKAESKGYILIFLG
jgi:hypothetical protein